MSRKDRFGARDKITHKMTRDGLVEQNQATGEQHRVSQRGQDFALRQQLAPADFQTGRSNAPASTGRRHQPAPASTPETAAPDFRQDTAYTPGEAYSDTQSPGPQPATGPDTPAAPSSGSRTPAPPPQASHNRKNAQARSHAADAAQPQHQPVSGDSPPPAARAPEPMGTEPVRPQPGRRAAARQDTAAATEAPPPAGDGDTGHSRLKFDKDAEPKKAPSRQQHSTQYARKFADKEAAADQPAPDGDNRQGRDVRSAPKDGPAAPVDGAGQSEKRGASGKLQFAADEKPPEPPGKKLTRARRKAERTDAKLEGAREKLPTKKKVRSKRIYDEQKGKAKRKFYIEKEVKSQRAHLKGPLPARPIKAGANSVIGYGHKKLYQVEHENVGVKAAHRGEMMAEGVGRTAYRFHRTRPYRRVAKLEKAAKKSHIKLSYQQALHDNPRLRSSAISRFMQKQKIKREYAKAAREAKRAAKRAKKTGGFVTDAGKALVTFIKRNPKVIAVVLAIVLLVALIFTLFSSCSNMAGGGFSSIFMSSYLAEDEDIDSAELNYSEWETDLLIQAYNAESSHSGYDEYRYNIDDVSHNPYELMAFLTAVYQDFTYSQVEAVLREIFAEQYTLEFVEEIEVRYRTVTDSEGNEYEEPYNWYILNVNLTARNFTDLVAARMNVEQLEQYGIYMQTKGNRAYITSPFAFNWLPYVTDYYGYRVHPISGEKDYHKGVDIGVPVGTEILAGHDGVVTAATYDDGYGWYVVIDGDFGVQSKYAHCDTLLVSAGQTVERGQVIARSGNSGTSTGPHLHLEVLKDGQYLNPLYFAETLDDGSGYIPPGSPGGIEFPEYPGEPIDSDTYAALIAEAEKHLGKPYVFGANGPNSFDCSSFVCWAFRESGVYPLSRTTAQGIYNQCTPIPASEAKPGDIIFFTGTYSTTSACSHVGIYVGNGMMIHAGNPVQYTSINSSYWQSHFYAFGRLPS